MKLHPHATLFKYHSVIGHIFHPNIKVRIPHESGGYLVKTNEIGFRSNKIPRNPEIDILVFGDSFTAGDGVSNKYRWTDRLNEFLPSDQRHLSFHNFGLSGSGTDQQYLIWREFARETKAQFIIVAVLVENIRRNIAKFRPIMDSDGYTKIKAKPYFELTNNDELILRHQPVPQTLFNPEDMEPNAKVDHGGRLPWLRSVINKTGFKNLAQRVTRYQPLPEYNSPTSYGWRITAAILRKWQQETDIPIIVIPIPIYQYVEETADARPYQKCFEKLNLDSGISTIDPLPFLQKFSKKERREFRFERDIHLTQIGHEALAQAISGPLSKLLSNRENLISS